MNRTSRIAVALWAGLAAVGWTDLLTEEPQGFTTTDAFYKTGADLNSGTIAIYNSLRGLQGQGPWTTLELASDQARADSREPNAGTYGPDRLDYDASTGLTGGYWTTMYSVITRANLVLAKAPDIATGNAQTKTYNVAEARFLRGYAYLWLTKDRRSRDRKSTRLNSSHSSISYDVFCLKKKDQATAMVWAPHYGGGYPFTGGRYVAVRGTPDFKALDANSDGVLTMADDPYATYYPGDDA